MDDLDLLQFDLPTNFASIIKVLGVGGGGSNAVNHMLKKGIKGVDFIVANTDNQALKKSPVSVKIQLGRTLTEGLGAGNQPDVGREAAIENIEDVKEIIGTETKMIFITAGMGGGTGTGGAPVIAEAAKEMGILTVGIVTIPFRYEGRKRIQSAMEGIKKMEEHVDALLIINNEKIREIYGNLAGSQALGMADEVLTVAAKGIAEIITVEGHINVDFADVKTVMQDSGIALMGTGEAEGENRAEIAITAALSSPLLDNTDIKGAKNILLNIISGTEEATLDEIGYINEYVQDAAGNDADLIWGSSMSEDLGDKIAVTVIATGFGAHEIPNLYPPVQTEKNKSDVKKKYINIGAPISETQSNTVDDTFKTIENEPSVTIKNNIKIAETVKQENKVFIGDAFLEEDDFEPDFEFVNSSETIEDIGNDQSDSMNKPMDNYLDNVKDLEDIPAYKRKGIKIREDNYPKDQKFSRYTLSENGGELSLNENNSYLHDKAD